MALDSETVQSVATWAVGLPSIGVLIAYGVSIIRRRASADNRAVDTDKSYSEMLANYKVERDEMRSDRERILARMTVIETERNNAVAQVGRLTAEVEFLSTQVLDLKALVEKMGTGLEHARDDMHKSSLENTRLVAELSYLTRLSISTKGQDEPNK